MQKHILLFLFGLSCLIGYPQGEANIWYFGNKAGLDFNTGSPTDLNDGALVTIEGCATMSNSNGQLLFYTEGVNVWTRNHTLMPNGDNLMGSVSSTQSAIIVPKPNSISVYYIFTVAATAGNYGLRYSEVDMNLNNGLGAVTNTKNILLSTPVCEKICAIKNADSDGYWVVTHSFGSNSFLAFSIDDNGVNTTAVSSSVGTIVDDNSQMGVYTSQGQLKFSPDGTKLVCVNGYTNVELFDFNAATGVVSNVQTINTNDDWMCYGAEFSQSGERLYLTAANFYSYNIKRILQYDLTSVSIPSSEVVVVTIPGAYNFGSLQLASDGKIYCAGTNTIAGSNFLSVINSPDIFGTGCQFQFNQIAITGKCLMGLPQSIQSVFDMSIAHEHNCTDTSFSLNENLTIISALWDFGDGAVSTDIEPVHHYAGSGTYLVSVTFVTPNGTFTRTKLITVLVSSAPTIAGIETVDFDDNNTITVNCTGLGDYEYSIDGIRYQDSNVFYHLNFGQYTIFVRDKNGCGSTVGSTYLLNYPKFFTPNNDGYNDYWRIKFSYLEPNLKVKIMDRFGNLIKILDSDSVGWDGTLDGQQLLSDDYWFVVTRDNRSDFKGHFALKR